MADPDVTIHKALDLENALPVIMIMLSRNYDMLTVIANSLDPATTAGILKAHELGELFGPPPAFDTDQISG